MRLVRSAMFLVMNRSSVRFRQAALIWSGLVEGIIRTARTAGPDCRGAS